MAAKSDNRLDSANIRLDIIAGPHVVWSKACVIRTNTLNSVRRWQTALEHDYRILTAFPFRPQLTSLPPRFRPLPSCAPVRIETRFPVVDRPRLLVIPSGISSRSKPASMQCTSFPISRCQSYMVPLTNGTINCICHHRTTRLRSREPSDE